MTLRFAASILAGCLLSLPQFAGPFSSATAADSLFGQPRITGAIDETKLFQLKNNVVKAANAANDRGALADDFLLEHLQLQLQRSSEQEQAVENFIDSLHDPKSPQFHKFLSAQQFGARFGIAASDLDILTGWLAGHGFQVNFVYPGGMVIDFSGTAGLVKAAFHTEIHRLEVNGAPHIANTSNPSIPAALQPVVAGVVSLTDFRAHSKHKHNTRSKYTGTDQCNGPCYLVTPSDLATIYNFTPLFQASPPITGKGQTIAVVEDSNLYDNKDWTDFRKAFGLSPYKYGSLEVVHPAPAGGTACADPGDPLVTLPDGVQLFDDDEATLDAEWASAAAPDATILVATCKATQTTDGVHLAIENLVNGASPPPIISISYGQCETDMSEALRIAFKTLYQQAVSEGISVFVASGDTGPESCVEDINPGPPPPGEYQPSQATGNGVDGWVSTPYDVAVGGTDFGDAYANALSTYWASSSVAPWGSAKSYIPEIPWNDTCASTLTAAYYQLLPTYGASGFCNSQLAASLTSQMVLQPLTGANGGPSTCATGDLALGTCKGYPKPTWQQGVLGIPADGVRDVPDVSMFASDGAVWRQSYALCYSNPNTYGTPCKGNPGNWAGPGNGGTSFAAPIVAGI
ncbi:MAG TPA: protease pro-enzyme activation domain-containing protein, partial [Rhodomicrobium sp.]|nr:protease pro-enzyme activation domain-containing protein [Rhodomicrobium sp.]